MKFSIMDRSGHTEELLATSNEAEVATAMARFDELVREHGMIAATKQGDGTHKVIKAFDPTATEVLFVPKLQGG
jgi:hypothetical protein